MPFGWRIDIANMHFSNSEEMFENILFTFFVCDQWWRPRLPRRWNYFNRIEFYLFTRWNLWLCLKFDWWYVQYTLIFWAESFCMSLKLPEKIWKTNLNSCCNILQKSEVFFKNCGINNIWIHFSLKFTLTLHTTW